MINIVFFFTEVVFKILTDLGTYLKLKPTNVSNTCTSYETYLYMKYYLPMDTVSTTTLYTIMLSNFFPRSEY